MSSSTKLWNEIEVANQRYKELRLSEGIFYDKLYLYSIITHSTAIEGSTLTEQETQLLFDEGLTARNKPLLFHLMNEDLKNAYLFASEEAYKKTSVTTEFLKTLNALVMKSTGAKVEAIMGGFDSSKGEFRTVGVYAVGGRSYMNYTKVPGSMDALCKEISQRLPIVTQLKDIYELSFDAHLNLVTIHPWADGNGRTSRLLMNYIQLYHGVVPSKTHKQDRGDYIKALNMSQDKENPSYFREFMAKQHLKTLKEEVRHYERSLSKGKEFSLLF